MCREPRGGAVLQTRSGSCQSAAATGPLPRLASAGERRAPRPRPGTPPRGRYQRRVDRRRRVSPLPRDSRRTRARTRASSVHISTGSRDRMRRQPAGHEVSVGRATQGGPYFRSRVYAIVVGRQHQTLAIHGHGGHGQRLFARLSPRRPRRAYVLAQPDKGGTAARP